MRILWIIRYYEMWAFVRAWNKAIQDSIDKIHMIVTYVSCVLYKWNVENVCNNAKGIIFVNNLFEKQLQ